MVIIASCSKHIQFGEERIQIILVIYTKRVVMKMVTLIICFVWFNNVVKHCNRTDFVLKLRFGNSFERSRLIIKEKTLALKYYIVAIEK